MNPAADTLSLALGVGVSFGLLPLAHLNVIDHAGLEHDLEALEAGSGILPEQRDGLA
jgi:hypothetical protein